MIGVRLTSKSTLLIGLAALAVTFVASRGTHSTIHEFLAVVAMVLEVGVIICSGLGRKRAAAILLAAAAVCWLAVVATDGAHLKIANFLAGALSFRF